VLGIEGQNQRSREYNRSLRGVRGTEDLDGTPRRGAGGAPPDPRSVIDAASEQDDFLVREAAAYLTSRGVDIESPEGQQAYARLVQQGLSRTGRAREQFVDNLRGSEGRGMQGARDERTADRQDVVATADYIDAAENAEGAAAALERIVASSGSMSARVMRGEGFMANAAAALAGPQAETDRAQWRDYLSNLLHERGGAALTEQEKAIINAALASDSWMSSPDATVATLRRIAARVRREAEGRRMPRRGPGGPDAQAPAAPTPATADGGQYRAGQQIRRSNGAVVTLTQEQADRLNARGQ
jgi:hypothetical protein